ncbi:hypothetical protein HDU76_007896, partial [Blyttiomyces sp. JEL0837]
MSSKPTTTGGSPSASKSVQIKGKITPSPSSTQVSAAAGGQAHSRLASNVITKNDSGDDDDDDDDDDEDEDEDQKPTIGNAMDSSVPPRRNTNMNTGGGGGAGRKQSLWTRTEEMAALKFYGLKSLKFDTWVEEQPQQLDDQEVLNAAQAQAAVTNAGGSNRRHTQQQPVIVSTESIDLSDPLGIKESIFGLHFRVELQTNKQFDAKVFLKAVHGSTSYRDMENGIKNLEKSLVERNQLMKNLVKQHFAKFVNAKGTID